MKTTLTLTSIAAALAFSASANAFVIDDFNTVLEIADSTVTPPTSTTTDTDSPAGIAFPSRTFTIDNTGNADGQAFGLTSGNSVLSVSKGPNSLGEYWVVWNGATVDFTQNGMDSVKYTILENNGPSPVAEFQFTIEDANGVSGTFDFSPPFVVSGVPQDFEFAYTDFSNAGTLDFTQITQFDFHVDSTASGNGVDLQMSLFETIDTTPPAGAPVPGTLLLMGAALLGMRRFSKKS